MNNNNLALNVTRVTLRDISILATSKARDVTAFPPIRGNATARDARKKEERL